MTLTPMLGHIDPANPAHQHPGTGGGADWFWTAMAGSDMLLLVVVGGLSLVGLIICVRVLWKLGKSRQPAGGSPAKAVALLADHEGTAMLEFALVFPVALFMILLLAQTTLAMGGNLFVHYAAFAATRTAIVQVPADYTLDGEPRNAVFAGQGNRKFDTIRQAAVFAVVPVAGRLNESTLASSAYVQAVAQFYQAYNQPVPAWVTNGLLEERLNYADANTRIILYRATGKSAGNNEYGMDFQPIDGTHTFGPRDPVTVRVEHDLNLSIPYVRAFFASGRHQDASGEGMFRTITAQYTLTNEGIDPNLPPTPPLPRQP